MKILFTGGGTGGHIFPLIAVIRDLKKIHPQSDLECCYMGPSDEFDEMVLKQEGIKIYRVFAGKIRRYFSIQNFFDVFRTLIGVIQSFYYVFVQTPDVIFSKGGYGAVPAVIAGWFLGVPIFVHESDIVPGLANKIGGKLAKEIFISFQNTEYFSPQKMIVVGNPIRREMLKATEEEAKITFNLTFEKPVILFLGGSQGAQKINDTVFAVLPELLSYFEVIHQCGEKNFEQLEQEARAILDKSNEKYYHLHSFLKEEKLARAFVSADMVVSRAGSGSIFEIAAFQKPSVLVPLSTAAAGHQAKNAYAYADTGAAIVLEEQNFTPRFFLEKLKYLFDNPSKLEEMSESARKFSRINAAKIIASYLLEFLYPQN